MNPPEVCPNCGAEIPPNARACPECGSDEKTGWSEQAAYDHLDLPDDSFNYEEFVRREFGDEEKVRPRGIRWYWWLMAVTLLMVWLGFLLRWW